MKTGQIVLILLGVAAVALAGWVLFRQPAGLSLLLAHPTWDVEVRNPIVIGDRANPFVYAGGAAVRPTAGSGSLRLFAADETGLLDLTLDLPASEYGPTGGDVPSGELQISASLRPDSTDLSGAIIHGRTGRGDDRLPGTRATLFGSASFDVGLRGDRTRVTYEGFWSVAQALRRDDGAIRNQGLVFSPLLRDDTVFADPERLEFTILLYAAEPGGVVLHVVYRDVEILTSPTAEPTTQD